MYIEKLEIEQLEKFANMLGYTIKSAEMTEHGIYIVLYDGDEEKMPDFYLTDFVCIPTKFCEQLIKNVNTTYLTFMSGEFDDYLDNLKKELIKEGVFKTSNKEKNETKNENINDNETIL